MTYYTEYVRHCLRFYGKHPKCEFHSKADKENWYACKNALSAYPQELRERLVTLYTEGDTLADNIYRMSKRMQLEQEPIWDMVFKLEQKVAKKRGLL